MATRGKQSGDKWASSKKTTASSACRRRKVGVEKGREALEIKEKLSSQTQNDPYRLSMSDRDFHIVKTKEIIPRPVSWPSPGRKGERKGKKAHRYGLGRLSPESPAK